MFQWLILLFPQRNVSAFDCQQHSVQFQGKYLRGGKTNIHMNKRSSFDKTLRKETILITNVYREIINEVLRVKYLGI